MILNYLENSYLILYLLLIILIYFLASKANTVGLAFNLIDKPNSRKLHKGNVPIVGGIIIFVCFGIKIIFDSFIYELNYKNLNYFIFSSIFFILGLIDDKYEINSYIKFISSILILIFAINTGLFPKIIYLHFEFIGVFWLESLSIFFTILSFLLLLNAMNMSDGINGYSVSLFIIFSIFICFKMSKIDTNLILLIILLLIVLIFNLKNKIFLGDSGVYFLTSYLSCYFIELGNSNIKIFAEEVLLVMFLPGLDMLRVFIFRIKNKSDPFKADRIHLHHLLEIKYGWIKSYLILISIVSITLLVKYIFAINSWYFIVIYIMTYIYFIYKNKILLSK